ncbi:hypothetical protein B566_EDAN013364 [Ephemera danica]|nr:hypothetical protein B566_EDAN013364 [Ephemera danica]
MIRTAGLTGARATSLHGRSQVTGLLDAARCSREITFAPIFDWRTSEHHHNKRLCNAISAIRSPITPIRPSEIIRSFVLIQYTYMVCDKCQNKVGKVITPDPWKSGARNTLESGGRKVGENKALTSSKARFNPYTSKFDTCRICRQKACAYKKGICAMCGKKMMDTKNYKQSSA